MDATNTAKKSIALPAIGSQKLVRSERFRVELAAPCPFLSCCTAFILFISVKVKLYADVSSSISLSSSSFTIFATSPTLSPSSKRINRTPCVARPIVRISLTL